MTVNLVIGNHHGEAASIGKGAAVHTVDSRDVSWPEVDNSELLKDAT